MTKPTDAEHPPQAWIIETVDSDNRSSIWLTVKPEVAAKYKNRDDAFVTPYHSRRD